MLSFADLGFGGGLVKGQRFMTFVARGFEGRPIEELPIPFSAVDLSRGIVGRNVVARDADASETDEEGWLRRSIGRLRPANGEAQGPSLLGVIAASFDIMQVRSTRSRMAGEPPDATVAARLA